MEVPDRVQMEVLVLPVALAYWAVWDVAQMAGWVHLEVWDHKVVLAMEVHSEVWDHKVVLVRTVVLALVQTGALQDKFRTLVAAQTVVLAQVAGKFHT